MQGPRKFYSQAGQDRWVIRDVFDYKTGGFFVDIGAFDGINLSNTYRLEKSLGWSGLCIEAEPDTFEQLKRNRRCACVNACVGPDGCEVEFVAGRGPDSGIVVTDYPRITGSTVLRMATLPIERILDDAGAPATIDYLTLDVEGMEQEVMSSFPFHKRRFMCATIERPSQVLRETLEKEGYLMVAELPGLDAFYIHKELSESYTSRQKNKAARAAKPMLQRLAVSVGDFCRLGLRASLRRI